MLLDVFRKHLTEEQAIKAQSRYFELQAISPKRGKARGGVIGGLIHAFKSGWVGSREHGLRQLGYRRRAGRRKPGKVDYGKPVVKRKSSASRAPRPGARVAVADPPADEYPC